MNTEPEETFPEKGDKAFIEKGSRHTHVYLDWYDKDDRIDIIADGFWEAADVVIAKRELDDDHSHADRLFYPVAFLYRHYLEMVLKSMIEYGIKLRVIERNKNIKEILIGHNLHKLWNKAKEFLFNFYKESDPEPLAATEKIIMEFHNADPDSQGFRYVYTIGGDETLKKAPRHIYLCGLRETMQKVHHFFECCKYGIWATLDAQNES
jgi:hypothetical protein